MMTRCYNILRAVIVTILLTLLAVPVVAYIVLSVSAVQCAIGDVAERELSRLTGAEVIIGDVSIAPFTRMAFTDVKLIMAPGDTVASIDRVSTGLLLSKLLFDKKLQFSHAELIGLNVGLWRETPDSPLNIQPIIDRLSHKDETKPPTAFDLRINNIVIRKSNLAYDVKSKPVLPGCFDVNHLRVSNLKADVLIPRLSNDTVAVKLMRLAATEHSGLTITSLSGSILYTPTSLCADGLQLDMPGSRLAFDQLSVKYANPGELSRNITHLPLVLAMRPKSYFTPSDFSPFYGPLADYNQRLTVDMAIDGAVDSLNVERLDVVAEMGSLSLSLVGRVDNLSQINRVKASVPSLKLTAETSAIAKALSSVIPMSMSAHSIINKAGTVEVSGSVEGTVNDVDACLDVASGLGNVSVDATYTNHGVAKIDGTVAMNQLNLMALTGMNDLGPISGNVDGGVAFEKDGPVVSGTAHIESVRYHGYDYHNVDVSGQFVNGLIDGDVSVNDYNLKLALGGKVNLNKNNYQCDVSGSVSDFNPNALALVNKYEGFRGSADLDININGSELQNPEGRIDVNNIVFHDSDGDGIDLPHITLRSSGKNYPQYVAFHSELLDAQLRGHYDFNQLSKVLTLIASRILPDIVDAPDESTIDDAIHNDFDFTLNLRDGDLTDRWLQFFNSPLRLLHNIKLNAAFQSSERLMTMSLTAPFLLHKDKFIDSTRVDIIVDGASGRAKIFGSTLYPTKWGVSRVGLTADAAQSRVATRIDVNLDGTQQVNGAIGMSALLSRNERGKLAAKVAINRSNINLNDKTWIVNPSQLYVTDNQINVNNFDVSHGNQYVRIDGTVSENSTDMVTVDLSDFNLDFIFDLLNIRNVAFGGAATGTFYASNLFSKHPQIHTPHLFVRDFSFNDVKLGNADIESRWDNMDQGVMIDAVISQTNGHTSRITGTIYPMASALDFTFKARRLNIGFLAPFFSEFTSHMSALASGQVRLFGTFRDLNVEGDAFAENLRMKIDFTNVMYSAGDSIHLRPGLIEFSDVTVRDIYGNMAKATGRITHDSFRDISYDINVSDARNLLCFDVNDNGSSNCYGRIFCNGGVHLKGTPGFTDINVTASTAPQSVISLVLSNSRAVGDYTFLTFNDRNDHLSDLLLTLNDPAQVAIQKLKSKYEKQAEAPSMSNRLRVNLQVNVTPDGELNLVMDPITGDHIRAYGNGNLRLEYNAPDNDVKMFGSYTLTQGNYSFSLQDIILKEFTIKPGSTLSFHGNPMDAQLDIEAFYSVNANLSDLDESFLQDRELNRTNVPVHALLQLSGAMQQPDISFDLELPTLSQDTYRKVKSIISTDEMMNRQIIYLLALSRFYTPEYMASTTKGNELVSMASSTISSQLSSMLGQLSDNWSIAPNFRSDKGDFSDVEVDVALSSYLLNNRLLLNGNFGYRDKSLTNNSFIGDFDLEYLLNNSGNVRLKAYNRYNDKNYYLRSALTTQGVGIMVKRDFDDISSWLRPLWPFSSRKKDTDIIINDSIKRD